MANKTIDQLDASAAIASGDTFPVASSGSDTLKRATVDQLVTYVEANTVVIHRHSYSAPYSYFGKAPTGTAESDATWTIQRIQVAADGSTTVKSATGAWTSRTSLTYT